MEARYAHAHSLGDSYQFDPRDGWEAVNITDLQYKYAREDDELYEPDEDDTDNVEEDDDQDPDQHEHLNALERRTSKNSTKTVKTTMIDTIKGVGKSEPVTITWYTGKDLLNPSCWSNPTWAPTDGSFAAALTLEGWTTKPKCFKFLELCNTTKKCVFVRVVDSCAGCATGSKHVDLTQAAFKELSDLDTGLLQVQMREATDPTDGWLENLWGPKDSPK
ncbi:hypothetical protein EIP86_001858 [Pleurotus ostreatoroseus]|nr:hypothetical protein EIP86_001858 [Pleurotus ostreatoroseus]